MRSMSKNFISNSSNATNTVLSPTISIYLHRYSLVYRKLQRLSEIRDAILFFTVIYDALHIKINSTKTQEFQVRSKTKATMACEGIEKELVGAPI
ncbi:unnamed protein product [Lactuca virosa]|uniref:Uncharacterized protein n=1 Tax=Lactuca virosa TaxID=75947 RepID=A0AAU9NZ34_9ASTR|nr:unnamed protein product [Lactuca virosa]